MDKEIKRLKWVSECGLQPKLKWDEEIWEGSGLPKPRAFSHLDCRRGSSAGDEPLHQCRCMLGGLCLGLCRRCPCCMWLNPCPAQKWHLKPLPSEGRHQFWRTEREDWKNIHLPEQSLWASTLGWLSGCSDWSTEVSVLLQVLLGPHRAWGNSGIWELNFNRIPLILLLFGKRNGVNSSPSDLWSTVLSQVSSLRLCGRRALPHPSAWTVCSDSLQFPIPATIYVR